MSTVINFSTMTADELQVFAAELIKKINAASVFTDEVDFELEGVEADEISGDLYISAIHDGFIEVPRKATWQASSEEDMDSPDEIDYEESVYRDVRNVMKTLTAKVDGYLVTIDINDVTDTDIKEVEVDSYSHEDDGIGSYEFWGDVGYDSRPYVSVEGTVVLGCACYVTFTVEPSN